MTLMLWSARRCAWVGGVLAAALLGASCGGSEQVTDFRADRVIAFGDESSLIVDTNGTGNGRKYGINGTVSATDPLTSCSRNAFWIQSVAALYGLVFPQCNLGPTVVVAPTSRIRATLGAKAADLAAQIDAQQAESAIGEGDIATVLVGLNDVLAAYALYPGVSKDRLTQDMQDAGKFVGKQANRLADTGVKVVLSTIVDAGVTPFARAENLIYLNTDRSQLLTSLSQAFNASMRGAIYNDGTRIGLVLLDELVTLSGNYQGLNGFSNTSVGACDLSKSLYVPPSVLDCSDLTLKPGAGANTFLWANDRLLSAGGQSSLGSLALSRIRNVPF